MCLHKNLCTNHFFFFFLVLCTNQENMKSLSKEKYENSVLSPNIIIKTLKMRLYTNKFQP